MLIMFANRLVEEARQFYTGKTFSTALISIQKFCRKKHINKMLSSPIIKCNLQILSSSFQPIKGTGIIYENNVPYGSALDKSKDYQKLNKLMSALQKFHFKTDDCLEMISKNPQLLNIPVVDLENNLHGWDSCKLNFNLMHCIFLNQPLFLTVGSKEAEKRVSYFQNFCKSNNILAKFLINCPNVMFDNWNSILLKLSYLYEEKRVAWSEIFLSKALTKQLDFIQLRLSLLEKCGVYKVNITYPHKAKKIKTHINPNLQKILDTDEEMFSRQVAGITLEEYNAFSELFLYSSTEENQNDDD